MRLLAQEAARAGVRVPVSRGGLTRRSFVKGLVAVAATGAASRVFPFTMEALAAAGGRSPRIAIIGGGLAGLSAAYHLHRAGFRAQVYEASNRLGGRTFSRTDVVAEGLVTDIGGELVNLDHADMLSLIDDFGIALFNREQDGENQDFPSEVYHIDGVLHGEEDLARDLAPLAIQIGMDSALLDEDFEANAPALDALSVKDYLDKHENLIVAPWIRTLIENTIRTEFGVEPEESSAIQLIYNLPVVEDGDAELLGKSDETYSVGKGSQAIALAIGDLLKDNIFFNRAATAIRARGGVTVIEFDGADPVEADFVICAIPFTVARTLAIEADLPPVLRRFINEGDLGANDKLIVGFNEKIWRTKKSFAVAAWGSGSFSEVWDESQRQPGIAAGALTFFLGGKQVAAAARDSAAVAGARMVAEIEPFTPGAVKAANGRYIMTNWTVGKYTRGAYSTFRPGQLTAFAPYFWVESDDPADAQSVAVGNLVFAGEHLSDEFFGFMNGAAQTGRLAAGFVMRAVADRAGAEKP